MKKTIISLIVILITFVSCNSDDDNTNEGSLIGSWKVYERGFYEDNSYNWTNIDANCINVEFRNDNTFTGYGFFVYPDCEHFDTFVGDWAKTGNILNLIIQGLQNGTQYDIDIDVEILSLSSNRMEIKFTIPLQFGEGETIFIHKYSRV